MENEQLANSITKAIAYTENGGKPTTAKAGKTGELASIFQFEPDTWDAYSKQVLGKVVPITPDAETYVVNQKVTDWYKKLTEAGATPETATKQIFSMWNAGPGEPNAYTGKFSDGSPSVGVNKKYGVKYDVPSYVDKATNYLKEFSGGNMNTSNNNSTDTSTPQTSGINQIVSMMSQATPSPQSQPQQETAPLPVSSEQGLYAQTGAGNKKYGLLPTT